MAKIKESPCCPKNKKKLQLRRRGGHQLAVRVDINRMHNALERVCLDKTVLDVALTKYFESWCDPDSRQNRYVSVWRMADVPPRC